MSGDQLQGDQFRIDQRFRLSTNVYEVRAGGEVVAWVRQKIMALRERIEIWSDESKSQLVCAVQARKVMELRSAYDVTDGDGRTIAVLQKVFGRSLVRSTWTMSIADGPTITVTETSAAIAIVRRIQGMLDVIPFVGILLALIPIPYGFTWTDGSGRQVATYRRVLGVRDRYDLDLAGDVEQLVDRRAAIAMAICLDALQSR